MNVCVCVLYNWSIHMQRLLQCNFNQPGTGVGSPAMESQHVQAAEGIKMAVSAQEHGGGGGGGGGREDVCFLLSWGFTSIETIGLIRDRELRTATLTFIQLLSSDMCFK